MKNGNLSGILNLLAGAAFIICGILSKQYVYIPIGAAFFAIGIVNSTVNRHRKK